MSESSPYAGLVPSPASPRLDWGLIADEFAWFRALADCAQDPVHHGEGNVLVHTRMVVDALFGSTEWPLLPPVERRVLLWAALLHDVAKPASTRVDVDGRISARGHSYKGQLMARRILWEMGAPFWERERICHLITHHQVPFFLLERKAPERLAHLISLQTRCDLLAILAEADARGRTATDVARLLDNIALFREFCDEQGCLDRPRAFASDHSRFLYFRKDSFPPDYEAYDDCQNRVTLLSGLPASGKDTWIAVHSGDREVISLDGLRAVLGIAPTDGQGAVVAAARERARAALRARRPFVWNATNLSRQIRGSLINLCADYRAKIEIVYVEAGPEELARRNGARRNPIPAKAIERMLERWEVPDLSECHTLRIDLS
jgi:predicted kinase